MTIQEQWEESLNIDVRFSWATEEQRRHILAEIKHQRRTRQQETQREVLEEIEKLKQVKPKGKCTNAENHLFGSCFECKKIDGYNQALSDLKQALITNTKGV
jgi:hypothetical protein